MTSQEEADAKSAFLQQQLQDEGLSAEAALALLREFSLAELTSKMSLILGRVEQLKQVVGMDTVNTLIRAQPRMVRRLPVSLADNLQSIGRLLGLSKMQLERLVGRCTWLVNSPLSTMESRLQLLTDLLGDRAAAVKCVQSCPSLLVTNTNKLQSTMQELQEVLCLPPVLVGELVVRHPQLLIVDSHSNLEQHLQLLQQELSLSRPAAVALILKVPSVLMMPAVRLQQRLSSLCGVLRCAPSQLATFLAMYPAAISRDTDTLKRTLAGHAKALDLDEAAMMEVVWVMPGFLGRTPDSLRAQVESLSELLKLSVEDARQLVVKHKGLLSVSHKRMEQRWHRVKALAKRFPPWERELNEMTPTGMGWCLTVADRTLTQLEQMLNSGSTPNITLAQAVRPGPRGVQYTLGRLQRAEAITKLLQLPDSFQEAFANAGGTKKLLASKDEEILSRWRKLAAVREACPHWDEQLSVAHNIAKLIVGSGTLMDRLEFLSATSPHLASEEVFPCVTLGAVQFRKKFPAYYYEWKVARMREQVALGQQSQHSTGMVEGWQGHLDDLQQQRNAGGHAASMHSTQHAAQGAAPYGIGSPTQPEVCAAVQDLRESGPVSSPASQTVKQRAAQMSATSTTSHPATPACEPVEGLDSAGGAYCGSTDAEVRCSALEQPLQYGPGHGNIADLGGAGPIMALDATHKTAFVRECMRVTLSSLSAQLPTPPVQQPGLSPLLDVQAAPQSQHTSSAAAAQLPQPMSGARANAAPLSASTPTGTSQTPSQPSTTASCTAAVFHAGGDSAPSAFATTAAAADDAPHPSLVTSPVTAAMTPDVSAVTPWYYSLSPSLRSHWQAIIAVAQHRPAWQQSLSSPQNVAQYLTFPPESVTTLQLLLDCKKLVQPRSLFAALSRAQWLVDTQAAVEACLEGVRELETAPRAAARGLEGLKSWHNLRSEGGKSIGSDHNANMTQITAGDRANGEVERTDQFAEKLPHKMQEDKKAGTTGGALSGSLHNGTQGLRPEALYDEQEANSRESSSRSMTYEQEANSRESSSRSMTYEQEANSRESSSRSMTYCVAEMSSVGNPPSAAKTGGAVHAPSVADRSSGSYIPHVAAGGSAGDAPSVAERGGAGDAPSVAERGSGSYTPGVAAGGSAGDAPSVAERGGAGDAPSVAERGGAGHAPSVVERSSSGYRPAVAERGSTGDALSLAERSSRADTRTQLEPELKSFAKQPVNSIAADLGINYSRGPGPEVSTTTQEGIAPLAALPLESVRKELKMMLSFIMHQNRRQLPSPPQVLEVLAELQGGRVPEYEMWRDGWLIVDRAAQLAPLLGVQHTTIRQVLERMPKMLEQPSQELSQRLQRLRTIIAAFPHLSSQLSADSTCSLTLGRGLTVTSECLDELEWAVKHGWQLSPSLRVAIRHGNWVASMLPVLQEATSQLPDQIRSMCWRRPQMMERKLETSMEIVRRLIEVGDTCEAWKLQVQRLSTLGYVLYVGRSLAYFDRIKYLQTMHSPHKTLPAIVHVVTRSVADWNRQYPGYESWLEKYQAQQQRTRLEGAQAQQHQTVRQDQQERTEAGIPAGKRQSSVQSLQQTPGWDEANGGAPRSQVQQSTQLISASNVHSDLTEVQQVYRHQRPLRSAVRQISTLPHGVHAHRREAGKSDQSCSPLPWSGLRSASVTRTCQLCLTTRRCPDKHQAPQCSATCGCVPSAVSAAHPGPDLLTTLAKPQGQSFLAGVRPMASSSLPFKAPYQPVEGRKLHSIHSTPTHSVAVPAGLRMMHHMLLEAHFCKSTLTMPMRDKFCGQQRELQGRIWGCRAWACSPLASCDRYDSCGTTPNGACAVVRQWWGPAAECRQSRLPSFLQSALAISCCSTCETPNQQMPASSKGMQVSAAAARVLMAASRNAAYLGYRLLLR